ncbi:MAG: putative ABC transport system ATP-binding protein [Planctomycetota bacterium]|jgi:putative ABC transport system ATP-binding protein
MQLTREPEDMMNNQNSAAAPPTPAISPWARLATLFSPDRSDLWSVCVFAVVSGVLLLATPLAVQALVDFVAFGAAVPSIAVIAALLAFALLAAASVSAVQKWIVEILQRRMFVRIVADVAARLPRLSWRIRNQYHEPELVNRFFDVVTIQKVGSALVLDGLANLLSIVVGLSVLAFYHPILLAFDIILLALIILLFLIPLRRGTRTAIIESGFKYEIASWLEEIARCPLIFKTHGSNEYVVNRSRDVATAYIEARRIHFRTVFRQVLAALGLQVMASTAILGIGGYLVVIGELTLGQLVAAELLVVLVVSAVAKLGSFAEKLYDLLAAVDKVGKLLDLEIEESGGEEPAGSGPAALRTKDLILLPPKAGKSCRPLNLTFEPGTITGITGPHGSGKTMFMEVLLHLQQPQAGSALLDGSHTSDLSINGIRQRISLAARYELLGTSISENVSLGRKGVDLKAVEKALQSVGLLEELQSLPQGLSTQVQPNGAPLSSGQRIRIVIARSLVSNPGLLLIDGLLDELSSTSRQTVLKTLTEGREKWTVIISSDRPEILEACDQVVDFTENEKEVN